MKNTFLTVGMLLFASLVQAQILVGPNSRLVIDHSTQDLTDSGVSRFELQVDAIPYVSIGLDPFPNPDTPAGFTSFMSPVGSLSNGLHTLKIRACNIFTCGLATPDLSIRKVAVPGMPTIRVSPVIAGAGIVQNRYMFQGKDIIDVYFESVNTTLNFASPTWTIPGIFNTERGDNVYLGLGKQIKYFALGSIK